MGDEYTKEWSIWCFVAADTRVKRKRVSAYCFYVLLVGVLSAFSQTRLFIFFEWNEFLICLKRRLLIICSLNVMITRYTTVSNFASYYVLALVISLASMHF